jgi:D-3-phosphoglycerate dehydrogenase
VLYEPDLAKHALPGALKQTGADVLVVRSTDVSAKALLEGRLSLVVRAGAGYNTIDVKTASEQGIWVSNCPGKNAIAVAELTFALMLAQDRHVADGARDLREGKWDKKRYSAAKGLYGRTLGVIGMGSIGREVAARARAFGMRVIAQSRRLTKERAEEWGVEVAEDTVSLARDADFVSVHLALNKDTRGLLGASFFSAMRRGAVFVNTARAESVDVAALVSAVKSGHIRAAVDVFQGEPTTPTGEVRSELFTLPGVIGSHHIGASTDQAQEAIADETVRIVRAYKETGRVPNAVNLAQKSPASHMIAVRHYDRVGVLASVFDCLKSAGINAEEIENIVFDGAKAAVARIHVAEGPSSDVLAKIRGCSEHVLDVSLVAVSG